MNTADKHRKALGKGLAALLPSSGGAAPALAREPAPVRLRIESLDPNPFQPRTSFDAKALQELAASIRANGIIQPLIVRKHLNRYQLVAGERRLRAAKLADLTEVPVVVQTVDDSRMLELALIENIQREDLNPIEAARGYQRLIQELHLSQEQVAERTGKDRVTITNTLRLLKLPEQVQTLVASGKLSAGHGRAILGLPTASAQIELAEHAAKEGLPVRRVEWLVHIATHPGTPSSPSSVHPEKKGDPNVSAAVEELERALGTRVRIVAKGAQHGRIEIEYFSQEELNRLYDHLVQSAKN